MVWLARGGMVGLFNVGRVDRAAVVGRPVCTFCTAARLVWVGIAEPWLLPLSCPTAPVSFVHISSRGVTVSTPGLCKYGVSSCATGVTSPVATMFLSVRFICHLSCDLPASRLFTQKRFHLFLVVQRDLPSKNFILGGRIGQYLIENFRH